MAAAATDYLTHVGSPGTATTLAAPGHTIAGASITVGSTSNWPTDTGAIFAMDTVKLVNGVETRVAGTYTEWEAVVSSATSITGMVLRYGTDQNYPAGSTTRVYIPVSSSRENRLVDGLLVAHNQDGTHKANMVLVTPKVDSIGENTAGAGVTVSSLLIKNGTPIYDGWMIGNETWTYASATTFTIAGVDRTARFPVGTKIKLTQTTAKYFYVVAASFSTDTTITITGGTDYTLANAAITSPFYSYMATPQGFPAEFNYTPTYTNFTIGNGTLTYGKFSMAGKEVSYRGRVVWGSTSSSAGAIRISYPVASASYLVDEDPVGSASILDSGVNVVPAYARHSSTTTMAIVGVATQTGANPVYLSSPISRDMSGSQPITFGTADAFIWSAKYPAA